MKIREKKDLRAKTEKELKDLLKEKRDRQFTLRIEASQNKLKNTREIFNLRGDMARILTFLKEKEFAKKLSDNPSEKKEIAA